MQPREYKFNNSKVSIIFGNILNSSADVIVSSDDTEISMGGGVSRAILRSGGEQIQIDAQRKLPARVGDVVVSTAGNLRHQKYVFHCLTKRYGAISARDEASDDNTDIEEYIIRHSIDRCFALLHAMQLRTIAFPCIGEGAAQIPFKKVAAVMAEAISANLSKTHKEFNVELYLFDRFGNRGEIDYLDIFEEFAAHSAVAKRKSLAELERLQSDERVGEDESMNEVDLPVKKEMNHDVFISYSRKDSETVSRICKLLDVNGLAYWIDITGVLSGDQYKKVIYKAIRTTKVVLFVSSENSNSSKNVVSEICYATSENKIIVPLKIDDAPYEENISYDILRIDHIEYSASDYEQRLVKSLKGAIEKMK